MKDILDDSPCAAPCWQGITPGKTTEQEAIDILLADTRSRYIDDPSIYHLDWEKGTVIRWLTKGAKMPRPLVPPGKWPLRASPISEVEIRKDLVQCIALTLDGGLTAQMVIDKWGTPSKVSAGIFGVEYIEARAGLFYPEQGIALSVHLDPRKNPLVLNPDSQVLSVRFYEPMPEEQWLKIERLTCTSRPDKILDWKGFGPLASTGG